MKQQLKTNLHPRNKHRGQYNFKELIEVCQELAPFVALNKYQNESINFFDPKAVKVLNKALLKKHYGISNWDIPQDYLCPPIPGRADYVHYLADLLGNNKKGNKITCLDIGVGANCVYPLIGIQEYGWSFIGSDVDPIAIESAKKIIQENPSLENKIEFRIQGNKNNIFKGILKKDERIDCTICNPPFHASAKEAKAATARKLNNLKNKKVKKIERNFAGKNNELFFEGGEEKFLAIMLNQSKEFENSCTWFTSLVSKEPNLKKAQRLLKSLEAKKIKVIPMAQGNKTSRILAWSFLSH